MSFDVDRVEMTVPVTVYRNVTCDRCRVPLPEQPGLTDERGLQYDNALLLRLEGGYGMFVDDYDRTPRGFDARYDKILCHSCSHLLAAWLGIDDDVRNWHTHRAGSGQHADHHDGSPVEPSAESPAVAGGDA